MAMDFWEAQRYARRQTFIYITLFILMMIGVAVVSELILRASLPSYNDYPFPLIGVVFIGITVCAAVFNYSMVGSYGGGYVARSMGARLVDRESCDIRERQLLNVVEEMAVASSLPMPEVYILDAQCINAFAAGLTADRAAIAVTKGSLNTLTRDELQGVIAHEFGHIHNGDMGLNMRLAALVTGFFIVMYLGLRLLQFSPRNSSRGGKKNGNGVLLAALAFIAAGLIAWCVGTVLRCAVSRHRESLADACAVQFTRNSDGLISALQKIEGESIQDMPMTGGAYAHSYFDHRTYLDWLLATHPPLQARINALKGVIASK